MKIRTRWIFTIILCLLIAIPLAACDGSPAQPEKQVLVSINILPLAKCGMLKVNGTLYENAASYKTTHTEGERITVEAIATSGHHFGFWGEDEVLSREPVYEFTVGAENISFAANFTGGLFNESNIYGCGQHCIRTKRFGRYNAYTGFERVRNRALRHRRRQRL